MGHGILEFVFSALQLKDDKWAPDFGPAKFVPSWGGTVTGVRKFLIAYNVNLLSTKEQAHRLADITKIVLKET